MIIIKKRDRFQGAMVGTGCGDAYLAPYEWTWTPEEIAADLEIRGGLIPHEYVPFDFIDPWDKNKRRIIKAGQPTDDSELAAALAKSLIEMKGLDEKNLYYWLRSFIKGRKSILTKLAYGKGSTLDAALTPETYEASLAKFDRGEIQTPPSNGSLMRCVPIPLLAYGDLDKLVELSRRQSWVTHRNPRAVAACIAYSIMVHYILTGLTPRMAWYSTRSVITALSIDEPFRSALQEIAELDVLNPPNFKTEIEPIKGSAVLSLRIAVWASIHAESFADGIIKVGLLAGDTDTYGAIAGGILGAYYGIEGIPKRWIDALQGKSVLIELADQLYDLAHS